MKSNVIIKSLDDTNQQYDWLEIDFNSYLYDEGNSGIKSHSNHYNLSVFVSNEEYHRVKDSLDSLIKVLYSVAN